MSIVVNPTNSEPSGILLNNLIARVKRHLSDRDNINKLKIAADESATSLTLTYAANNISRGSLLNIDNELFYVWDYDSGTKTATVERSYDNTVLQFHSADSVVNIGGKSRAQIIDAINDELQSLSSKDLFQMRALTIPSFNAGQLSYPLTELDRSNIYDVQCLTPGQDSDWQHLRGWHYSAIDHAISFDRMPLWGTDVRVLYKTGFDTFTTGTDDIQSDIGLQAEAADVLIWGALYRLTIGDEYIRDDFRTQGDTRRPAEVPAGAVLRSTIAGFKAIHDERLADERDRLRRQFPTRRLGW